MYLSQAHGSESALCAGACRRFEAGAEGPNCGRGKGGENRLWKTNKTDSVVWRSEKLIERGIDIYRTLCAIGKSFPKII